jgi:hypothetical protein
MSNSESRGIEDARFVRLQMMMVQKMFATYTAFNGHCISQTYFYRRLLFIQCNALVWSWI